jgi:hypothetical protein
MENSISVEDREEILVQSNQVGYSLIPGMNLTEILHLVPEVEGYIKQFHYYQSSQVQHDHMDPSAHDMAEWVECGVPAEKRKRFKRLFPKLGGIQPTFAVLLVNRAGSYKTVYEHLDDSECRSTLLSNHAAVTMGKKKEGRKRAIYNGEGCVVVIDNWKTLCQCFWNFGK